MKKIFYMLVLAISALSGVSCQKEQIKDTGVTSISNSREGETVYYKGEEVYVDFEASAAWTAELEFADGQGWAEIRKMRGNDKAGNGSVTIDFKANDTGAERKVTLWIRVNGKSDNIGIEFTQASEPESSAMSEFLNAHMDEILQKDYLWAEQYLALKKDLTVSYDEFLFANYM